MKIGLIIPPSLILSDERFFMHLGILKVAAVLEKAGVPVEVLDLSGVQNYKKVAEVYVSGTDANTFGITATSPQMPASVEIAEVVRRIRPQGRVILGGPHVTLVQAAVRGELRRGTPGRAGRARAQLEEIFDTLVAGDGEESIFLALEEDSVSKVIDADDPKSPLFLTQKKLTEMPFPARHLVDVKSYHYAIDGIPAISMIAQLGCPFQCGFCGGRESPFLRRPRIRSTESVIAEMREIYTRFGFRAIMFYDDELNVNKEMVPLMKAIAQLGKELGIEWRLRGFAKAELFTNEQADTMREAGFRELLTGFESGSPRILKNIRKNATQEENTRCVEIAHACGLRVKALMSIGHPGESEETIKETRDWVLAMRPESFDLTRITVYPGTPYFDHAVPHKSEKGVWTYTAKNGDRLHSREVNFLKDFLYYKGDRGDRLGLNKFFAFTDELSVDDLASLRKEIEDELREKLGQPYQTDAPAIQYEHSMGLPEHILRQAQTD